MGIGIELVLTAVLLVFTSNVPAEGGTPIFPQWNPQPCLEWRNISVRSIEGKTLVCEQSGVAHAGRLLGVLGPSGCGKTTFLRTLAGEITPYGGKVKLWAQKIDNIELVHQTNAFFSMLTVRETLSLAQSLIIIRDKMNCTDSTICTDEIEGLLESLCLSDPRDLRRRLVGATEANGEASSKGRLSGGERKRLAIACAMLGKPRALLLDEPTSGLDSVQALQVVHLLKTLAIRKEIAVVCSIHQPRSSIWALLDDVLLMAPGGKVAYIGPTDQALQHFRKIGFACPTHTNPAEFLLDLVALNASSKASMETSKAHIDEIVAAAPMCESAPTPNQMKNVDTAVAAAPHSAALSTFVVGRVALYVRTTCHRFLLLLQRSMRQAFRDSGTNLVRSSVFALLAAVIAVVHNGPASALQAATAERVAGRVNIIAQAVINVAMLSIIKTLQLFKKERCVMAREMQAHLYRPLEYLLAKASAELPLDAAVAMGFGWVLHQRARLACNAGDMVGLLGLLGAASSSMGLAISALAPSAEIALTAGPALMIVYLILGAIGPAGVSGSGELPAALKWVRACSPMRWGCEGLCAAEFTKRNPAQQSKGFLAVFRLGVSKLFEKLVHWRRILVRFRLKRESHCCDKDRTVLKGLGIGEATYAGSVRALWVTLLVHLLLALLGLHISRDVN